MTQKHYGAQNPSSGVKVEKPLSPRGRNLPVALRPTAEDNLRNYQAWLAEREQRIARAKKVKIRVR